MCGRFADPTVVRVRTAGVDLPSIHARDVWDLLPAAVGIFFVGFSDAILTGRSFAGKNGQNVRADHEPRSVQSFVLLSEGLLPCVDDATFSDMNHPNRTMPGYRGDTNMTAMSSGKSYIE